MFESWLSVLYTHSQDPNLKMKCPKCGYNSFDSLNECKRCGARVEAEGKIVNKASTGKSAHDDIENFALFENENEEPVLLEEEFVDDYSFHGSISRKKQKATDIKGGSPESYLELASFSRRSFAFILDITVILVVSFFAIIIGLLAAGIDITAGVMKLSYILIPVYIILCLLASTVLFFLHAYSGKTFGKLVFGISVVGEDGGTISLGQSFARWVGYYLSALPVFYGYLSAFFDYNLQTWHDKISKTYVIKDN